MTALKHTFSRNVGFGSKKEPVTGDIYGDIAPRTAERLVKYCENQIFKSFNIATNVRTFKVKRSHPHVTTGHFSRKYYVSLIVYGAARIDFYDVDCERGVPKSHYHVEMVTA